MRPYPPPPATQATRFSEPAPGPWELMICDDLADKEVELTERLVSVEPGSRGTIYFDSCGGSAYTGLALASLIRLRGLDATAVVVGECSSAAILPLAACARRFVLPHSTLLFHPVKWQSDGEVMLEEAAEWARHFRILEADLDQLLARMLPLPIEKVTEWTRPGRFVTGPEFAAAGLATLVDLFSGTLEQQIREQENG